MFKIIVIDNNKIIKEEEFVSLIAALDYFKLLKKKFKYVTLYDAKNTPLRTWTKAGRSNGNDQR